MIHVENAQWQSQGHIIDQLLAREAIRPGIHQTISAEDTRFFARTRQSPKLSIRIPQQSVFGRNTVIEAPVVNGKDGTMDPWFYGLKSAVDLLSMAGGAVSLQEGRRRNSKALKGLGMAAIAVGGVGTAQDVTACSTAPQVVEVATATPQVVETIQAPVTKEYTSVTEQHATKAILEWLSDKGSGVSLRADQSGQYLWEVKPQNIHLTDANANGKPVGEMTIAFADTNQGIKMFFFQQDLLGNTEALVLTNTIKDDGSTLQSGELVDLYGNKQASLTVTPNFTVGDPWATLIYDVAPNQLSPTYNMYPRDVQFIDEVVSVEKPLLSLVPITPTAEAATTVPTEAAPTEAAAAKIIDVSKSSSEWDLSSLSADQQAAIKNWLANPSGATEQEKQIADDFLTKQWQLTLETDATGKALYEKIVAYAQSHGGEVGLIPNSLHLQVRTDKDNLVVYGSAPGMDKYVHTSWYGFGANVSNPSMHIIEREVVKIPQINYFGEAIKREGSVYPVTSAYAVEGDLIGIFDIVGVPRSEAQGAIIKMIDQKGVTRYTEIQIQYASTLKTSANDMCTQMEGNQIVGGNCEEGLNLPITTISSFKTPNDNKEINNQLMVQVLKDSNGKLHVVIYSSGTINGKTIYGIWQNGASASQAIDVFSDIQIP